MGTSQLARGAARFNTLSPSGARKESPTKVARTPRAPEIDGSLLGASSARKESPAKQPAGKGESEIRPHTAQPASIVVDMSGASYGSFEQLTAAANGLPAGVSMLAIVDNSEVKGLGPRVDVIDVSGLNLDATTRVSLALRSVGDARVLVASAPIQFEGEQLLSALADLDENDLVEIVVDTSVDIAGVKSRLYASRTVLFAVSMSVYVALRGLDLRLTNIRDAYEDLVRRVTAWGSSVSRMRLGSVVANEVSLNGAGPRSRAPSYQRWTSMFANVPRWPYAPADAPPTITLFRERWVGDGEAPLTAVASQTLDSYDVVDLWPGPDGSYAQRRELPETSSPVIAYVPRGFSVLPSKLASQLSALRSRRSLSVGRVASIYGGAMTISESAPTAGTDPLAYRLAAAVGPRDSLISGLMTEDSGIDVLTSQRATAVRFDEPLEVSARELTEAEARELAPFGPTPDETWLLFDQFTVGKVDYIDAYDRVDGIVAAIADNGKVLRELCLVRNAETRDLEVLAGRGVAFEVLCAATEGQDVERVLAGALVRRLIRSDVRFWRLPDAHNAENQAYLAVFTRAPLGTYVRKIVESPDRLRVERVNDPTVSSIVLRELEGPAWTA